MEIYKLIYNNGIIKTINMNNKYYYNIIDIIEILIKCRDAKLYYRILIRNIKQNRIYYNKVYLCNEEINDVLNKMTELKNIDRILFLRWLNSEYKILRIKNVVKSFKIMNVESSI